MRYCWLALATGLVGGAALHAQPQPGTPAPAASRLDYLLQRWEQEMKGVQTLVAQCQRFEKDKINGTEEVYVGTARFLRPNLAVLDMQKQNNPNVYEKFVCNGNLLYEYRPLQKVVRIHELPTPREGQQFDDSFLGLLFGMNAEEAKRRYDLRLVKEDQWYVYVEIFPRFAADKVDFQKARLVLNQNTFLPRELWFEQPNGNEVKWDMPKIQSGVRLEAREFTPPGTPPGWNVVRVPRPQAVAPAANDPMPAPRVVRPNQ
ncbi:MAG: TIGR03009 domain-containing protein [Gemmataceae bacterium]